MTLPMQNNPDAWLAKILASTRAYRVQDHIQHAKTCVDVGANVGGFIINYHKLFDKIYAIEASENNAKLCKKNIEANGVTNTEVTRAAAGKTDGETLVLRMYDNKAGNQDCGNFGVTGFAYEENGHGWNESEHDEEVESVCLESIIEKVGPINCLKVDIEGGEYDFLYGKDLSQVDYIFMEIHNFLVRLNQGQELVDHICKTHDILTPYKAALDSHQELVFRRKQDASAT